MESSKCIGDIRDEKPPLTIPSSSIFGTKTDYKTVKIQQVGQQYKETIEQNRYDKENPEFKEMSPFKIFPNIVGKLVQGPTGNYFFDALYLAYTCHGELVLSPSDIWLAILAEFSQYVCMYAEELRSKIVTHQGKQDLVLYVSEENPNYSDIKSDEFRWDLLVNEFSELIRQNTLIEIQKIVECDFSCSSQIDIVISQVALMHGCKNYFNYKVGVLGCGIEKVHFLGTREDWVNLQQKIQSLLIYSVPYSNKLVEWIKGLEYVIDNFMLTYDGQSNIEFWNSIVQRKNALGYRVNGPQRDYFETQVIDGWILNFFYGISKKDYNTRIDVQLYVNQMKNQLKKKNEEKSLYKKIVEFFSQKNNEEKDIMINENYQEIVNGVQFCDIPAIQFKAPVVVEYQRTKLRIGLDFVGGFTGVLVESNAYRPQVSFAVANRTLTDTENNMKSLF